MYDEIIEAFTIFKKYSSNDSISAEHDELFAGPDPSIVSKEDLARLKQLHWHPVEYGCFRMFT